MVGRLSNGGGRGQDTSSPEVPETLREETGILHKKPRFPFHTTLRRLPESR